MPSITSSSSPFWGYGFYPYYFGYAPFFYDPFYRSYFFEPYAAGFAYGPDKGEVRLDAKPSSASVYLNDSYAGTARPDAERSAAMV